MTHDRSVAQYHSSSPPSVTVVVPLYNERANLDRLYANVQALSPRPQQVVLVDGGSSDGTYRYAQTLFASLAPAVQTQVLISDKSRARQMNAGAAAARAEVVVFLHADTQLPPTAIQHVAHACQTHVWGRFDVRIDSPAKRLAVVGCMINWRSRLTSVATGDQAIFVRRHAFLRLGGFADLALMEDVELCKRLRPRDPPACLSATVITSARRWHRHGINKTIWLMWQLRFAYWRGVDANTLARRYR